MLNGSWFQLHMQAEVGLIRQTAQWRPDLCCAYLAQHEPESMNITTMTYYQCHYSLLLLLLLLLLLDFFGSSLYHCYCYAG